MYLCLASPEGVLNDISHFNAACLLLKCSFSLCVLALCILQTGHKKYLSSLWILIPCSVVLNTPLPGFGVPMGGLSVCACGRGSWSTFSSSLSMFGVILEFLLTGLALEGSLRWNHLLRGNRGMGCLFIGCSLLVPCAAILLYEGSDGTGFTFLGFFGLTSNSLQLPIKSA